MLEIEVEGKTRYYELDKKLFSNNSKTVYVFHGKGGDINSIRRRSGFSQLGRKEGFNVIYPQAYLYGEWKNETDVPFIAALMEKHPTEENYIVGYSMGGAIASRCKQYLYSNVDGLALVSYNLSEFLKDELGSPMYTDVPIVIMHGDTDPISSVNDTFDTVKYWYDNKGVIEPQETVKTQCSGIYGEKDSIKRQYGAVTYYLFTEGGHPFPSDNPGIFNAQLGRTVISIDNVHVNPGATVIWDHFKR